MSSLWADLTEAANVAAIDTFGFPATLQPQGGLPAVSISGVIMNPAMGEDVAPTAGASVLRFFVNYSDVSPAPRMGDVVVISGFSYAITEPVVDTNGAAVLKLRIM
jgi:hypothetical protein